MLRAKENALKERQQAKQLEAMLHVLEAYQAALQEVVAAIETASYGRIGALVTRCLRAVFDPEPYAFEITAKKARGRTECLGRLKRFGRQIDPLAAAGGGVIDVATFALRVAALVLYKRPLRRVLVLDEPFRFVSVEYRAPLKALVLKLADELNIQFIIVTHIEELKLGNVIDIRTARG